MFSFFKKSTVKIWSSACDGNGCLECCKLEGQAVPLNGYFQLDGKRIDNPPLHKGCRCACIYEEDPEPQLVRDYKSVQAFAEVANTSVLFHDAENGYWATVYFLEKIVAATPRELKAAGISRSVIHDCSVQLQRLRSNKDLFFDQLIDRAYKYTVNQARELKTERGRNNRLKKLKEEILQSKSLSDRNIEHLTNLIPT